MNHEIKTSAGAIEWVYINVSEDDLQSLSSDLFEVSLGSRTDPGTWFTPESVSTPVQGTARLGFLVGQTLRPATGEYFLWVRVTDSPEVIPFVITDGTLVIS